MSGLIWIQTVRHSDGISERILLKKMSGLIWIKPVWHSDGIPERILLEKKCWAWSWSKLFDTLMVFLKEFFWKKMLGLIWIQTVWHSDGIPDGILLKKKTPADDEKKHIKLPSMQRVNNSYCVSGKRYQCSHCNKVFSAERLLRDHMRNHGNYHYYTPGQCSADPL